MDRRIFWKLIDDARAASGGAGEPQVARLQGALEKLAPEEIIDFDRIFDQLMQESYTWDLWGAAFIVNGGCSDDGFVYFRAWLIAQGDPPFRAALADPESLASVAPVGGGAALESLTYVANKAYRGKMGKSMPPTTAGNVQREPSGESWEEEELEEMFPRLWAKFGG
jgi:hypothetical protein